MTALYVYGLTTVQLPSLRAEGTSLESIDLDGGIFAVAERMDSRPAVSEEALRHQHDIIGAIAARTAALLPARFGSFVEEDELRRIVQLRRDIIAQAFETVRDREQMTIRLTTTGDAASGPGMPAEAAAGMSGREYLEGRRTAASGLDLPGVEAVRQAVKDAVAAERIVPGEGRLIATLYHLVPAGTARDYRLRVARIQQEIAPVVISVTGPWPAFAFAPELIA
jgi:hypothetical protein